MNVHYRVELGNEERAVLEELVYRGSPRVRKVKRALILLAADRGESQEDIAQSLHVGTATVFRTKRDFVEEGLQQALEEAPRKGGNRKLSDNEELLLVATACSDPPQGTGPLDDRTARRCDGAADLSRAHRRRDDPTALARQGDQALAAQDVVHSQGGWRLRSPHGGCGGTVHPARRPRSTRWSASTRAPRN